MKIIITLILSAFLLTSCSNPDTSGGVTLHKRPGEPNAVCESDGGNKRCIPGYTDEFPHGLCTGPTELGAKSQTTGCGYFSAYGSRYYIRPGVNLSGAKLNDAKLNDANLRGANLRGADLTGADLRDANLRGADFRGRAHFNGSPAQYTKLWEADFSHADTYGAITNSYISCPDRRRYKRSKRLIQLPGMLDANCPF